jgi:hypothetical protein
MAGAASAHQAATATREDTSQQRAGRTRRTSADPQRARQGATAAAAAPAALDSLSRLQQLADASPQVAQLWKLQALADGEAGLPPTSNLHHFVQRRPPHLSPRISDCGCEACTGRSLIVQRKSDKQDKKKAKIILQSGFDGFNLGNDIATRRVAVGNGYKARSGSGQEAYSPVTNSAWNSMVEKYHVRRIENRDIDNCAEAHLWRTLKDNNVKPDRVDVLVGQYDKKGKIKGDKPCRNCSQWVHKEFKSVSKL